MRSRRGLVKHSFLRRRMLSLRLLSGFAAMAVWAFLPGAGHGAAYYAARPARVQGTDPRRSVAYPVGARPELGLFRRSSGARRRRSPLSVPHNLAEQHRYPAKAIPARAVNIHFSLLIRSALMSAACSSGASLLVPAQSLGFSAEAQGPAAVAVLPSCPIT